MNPKIFVQQRLGSDRRGIEIPPDGLETPHGRLYPPLAQGRQIAVVVVAFFGWIALGWLAGRVPGDLSETAMTVLYIPYALIFFLGYALWIARLRSIVFQGLGRAVLKAVFQVLVLRRKPPSMDEVIPSQEKLLEMMVRAQRAGTSFALVGWPVGLVAGPTALLFDTPMNSTALFLLVSATCIGWGHLLGRLGRRGWLPFAEES